MSTYTDTELITLSSILSADFVPEVNFKLVDYVYDGNPHDPEDFEADPTNGGERLKSIVSRTSGHFVYEIDLKVDIDGFFDSPIDGYAIYVGPADGNSPLENPEIFYSQEVYFGDDFKEVIDIGEGDTEALKSELRKAQTLIGSADTASPGGGSSLSTRANSSYVSCKKLAFCS